MNKFALFFVQVAVFGQLSAQTPFKALGIKDNEIEYLTLSDGRYNEFHGYNDFERVGSAIIDMRTHKIVRFIDRDSIQDEGMYELDMTTRFLTIDPMAEKYPFLSPYAYCANNPIKFIDPDGCEFTEDAWKWVNRLIADVNSRQASNNAKIAEKQAKLDAGGLSARQEKALNRQIGRLENESTQLEGVRGEVATLAASDQTYNVIESSSQNERGPIAGMGTEIAYTSFNFNTGNVDITISPGAGLGLFAHELLHGYQFETGQTSLGDALNPIGYSFLLDKTDEVAGYQRQGLFGSNEGATSINTLPERYRSLPLGPIDVNNFSFQGRRLTDANQYELKQFSKIMKQAFRYNGKTIY